MTQTLPKISVVTPSFNQGAYIAQTVESVASQEYPNLEHIVVDGMSTDQTQEVLARYQHLKVIREPDNGQADAINKGFRGATGEILCYLNSDDTFLPGTLERVAREIDPARNRHVVMGRCRFIDENDNFLGVEHPSFFESHRRVLEIWRGHGIPQPAVFWTRQVWEACGPMDEKERLLLDYDLFCRFSQRFTFHTVDQVFATYRLHSQSKTSSMTDEKRLEDSIQVSRRYWGSPFSVQRWQILASYAQFRLDRQRRAVNRLRAGRDELRNSRPLRGVWDLAVGSFLGPDVVMDVAVMPVLRPHLWNLLAKKGQLSGFLSRNRVDPRTAAWRDFTSVHNDGWVGPVLVQRIDVGPTHRYLRVHGSVSLGNIQNRLEMEAFLDGRPLGRFDTGEQNDFAATFALGAVEPGPHELRLVSSRNVVPHQILASEDFRPLSFRLQQLELRDDG